MQNATGNASLLYYLLLLWLARLMGCCTELMGAGIGPIRGRIPMKITVRLLKGCERIQLRDEASRRLLREAGVPEELMESVKDPATRLSVPPATRRAFLLREAGVFLEKPYFCVILRAPKGRVAGLYAQKLGAAIRLLARGQGFIPVFLTLDRKMDERITAEVCGRVDGVRVRLREATDALACISGCQFLISMRLHGLIFASMTERPAIGISATEDEPKLAEFCRAHRFPHFDALDWSVAELVEAMERAMEARF